MKLDRILLVEDNEDDAILVQCALEDAGIPNPVHVVETAEAAMEYLSTSGKGADPAWHSIPAAVFVDLKLPGKSGHDLLSWMKEKPELGPVLKVMLTGSDNAQDRSTAMALGADCYLEKPLTKKHLLEPSRSIGLILTGGGAFLREAA